MVFDNKSRTLSRGDTPFEDFKIGLSKYDVDVRIYLENLLSIASFSTHLPTKRSSRKPHGAHIRLGNCG